MGCVIALLRVLGRLVLGLAIFAGLLHFLVISNFTQRLVDSDVYGVAISDTDAYNRIYDEVLVDDALSDESQDLVGGLEIDAQEEAVELLRQVMPPSYLQEQTEDNIDRFTGFLNGDVDRLEIYVELKEPLERLEPTVEAEVYQYIDELEIVEAREPGCSPATIAWLATNSAKPLDQISNGELPESAPSLLAMTRECRESQFEAWFERVVTNAALSSQTSILLQSAKEDLREPFEEGDTKAFLKAAVTPLIGPLVEDAVSDIRRELTAWRSTGLDREGGGGVGRLHAGRSGRTGGRAAGRTGVFERNGPGNRTDVDRGGRPAAGGGASAGTGAGAAMAGRVADAGRRRVPDCRVRDELGDSQPAEPGGNVLNVLLRRRAGFVGEPGGRPAGVVWEAGHGRIPDSGAGGAGTRGGVDRGVVWGGGADGYCEEGAALASEQGLAAADSGREGPPFRGERRAFLLTVGAC